MGCRLTALEAFDWLWIITPQIEPLWPLSLMICIFSTRGPGASAERAVRPYVDSADPTIGVATTGWRDHSYKWRLGLSALPPLNSSTRVLLVHSMRATIAAPQPVQLHKCTQPANLWLDSCGPRSYSHAAPNDRSLAPPPLELNLLCIYALSFTRCENGGENWNWAARTAFDPSVIEPRRRNNMALASWNLF